MIALMCSFLMALYAYVLYWRRKVKLSGRSLRSLYLNKFSSYREIYNIALLTYAPDSEVMTNMRDELNRCQQAAGPLECVAAEKRLLISNAKLLTLIKKYPLLYETDRYKAIKDELVIQDEKIAFSRQFYNKEVLSYNTKAFVMPAVLMTGILNLKREETI